MGSPGEELRIARQSEGALLPVAVDLGFQPEDYCVRRRSLWQYYYTKPIPTRGPVLVGSPFMRCVP
jgi:hypothetical protein